MKSLAELGWFLSLGTAAQLFAVVVVVVKLLMSPMPDAATELVHTGAAAVSVVAVMNLIFACASHPPFMQLGMHAKGAGIRSHAPSTLLSSIGMDARVLPGACMSDDSAWDRGLLWVLKERMHGETD